MWAAAWTTSVLLMSRRNRSSLVSYVPTSRKDALVALIGLVLCVVAVSSNGSAIATRVAGPTWLLGVYAVLMGVPLAWRRHSPLAAYAVVMAAIILQAVVTGDSPEGLHLMYCGGASTYAVAAYSSLRRAVIGLVIGMFGYAVYALNNHDIRTGLASEEWAGSFFAVALLTVWLVGVFVRYHRREKISEQRARKLERQAREAVSQERARLARELHDVVTHNLSVMVVQAAGARASGDGNEATLEKIENSGRESLVEMRRLLGVLRRDDDAATLAPQPGIGQLEALTDHVRAAGVRVELTISGDTGDLPQALDLSVYRIVQEALTNVLRHAGPATASVFVDIGTESVTVDVSDDGHQVPTASEVGHGLIGMRERVLLFGGQVTAGPGAAGGFVIHAELPRVERPS